MKQARRNKIPFPQEYTNYLYFAGTEGKKKVRTLMISSKVVLFVAMFSFSEKKNLKTQIVSPTMCHLLFLHRK